MADAGQPQTPDNSGKNQDGGSGKKKSKQAKKGGGASSGDGMPNPSKPPQKQTGADVGGEKKGDKGKQKATPTPHDKSAEKAKAKGDAPGAESGEPPKSKAQLKAERRVKQEADRARKVQAQAAGGGGAKKGEGGAASTQQSAQPASGAAEHSQKKDTGKSGQGGRGGGGEAASAGGEKKQKKKSAAASAQNMTEEEMWAVKEKEILGKSLKIDNSILNLGFQYFHHKIIGANARCLALLSTLREMISKYKTPEEKELSRDLEKNFLNPCITYLNYCRPLSTSMGNAIKHLKYHISQIPSNMDDDTAIAQLQEVIDDFISVNIVKAAEAVAIYADNKIDDDDVILIYAASSLIGQVLKTAHKKKRFRVIVVEGRPRTEGKSMLKFLVRCGIPCSYVYIGSASHAMNEATKVFLGAAAMFSIGDMHSRTGNSMIAALAKANNVPVLVCCETYKFTDKVQLHMGDSNLHARGKDLLRLSEEQSVLAAHQSAISPNLSLLNLMYDVTKSEYITCLVTDLGMLPCTSVPVVLRRQEDLVSEGA